MCRNVTSAEAFPVAVFLSNNWTPARTVSAVVGFLSTLACVGIIATFVAVPKLRLATSRRILVYLSVADLVVSLTNSIGALVYLTKPGCHIQAAITVAGSLASVFWSTCLAVYIYMSVAKDNVVLARKLQPVFHVVSWGIPIAVAVVGKQLGAFGSTRFSATVGWCWITEQPDYPEQWWCDDARLLWMLVTLKGWECATYVLIPAMYVAVKLSIRRATSPETQPIISNRLLQAISMIDKKVAVMPIAYVLLRMWGTIRAFLDYTTSNEHISEGIYATLFYLQAIGDNAQGIVNFILFVLLNKAVRNELPTISSLCCRHKKMEGQGAEDHVELLDSATFDTKTKVKSTAVDPLLPSVSSYRRGQPLFWSDTMPALQIGINNSQEDGEDTMRQWRIQDSDQLLSGRSRSTSSSAFSLRAASRRD